VAASPSSAFSFLLVIDFCFYEVNNILIVWSREHQYGDCDSLRMEWD
jgi:hypothetical protein